jgi:hypothetical protein
MDKLRKPKYNYHLQTYVTKEMSKKISKTWRKSGYISESDYLRDLVRVDIKN